MSSTVSSPSIPLPLRKEQIEEIHARSRQEFGRRETKLLRNKVNFEMLHATESCVKMCLFTLTLRYFQACNYLKKQKRNLSGEDNPIRKQKSIQSLARIALDREVACAKQRDQALKKANDAARRGAYRIQRRKENILLTKVG